MSVRSVARKDFLDARRARIVWLVGAHYAVLVAAFFAQVRVGGAGGRDGVLVALWNLAFVGAVFVPAIALVAAYLAIAGERESGSVKFLLSTPVSRREVVLGKYLSRAGIVAASLAVAFAVAAALALVWFGSLRPGAFLGIAALTTAYALAYVAVAIAVSAATATRARAMTGAIGFYLVTNLVTLFDDVSGLAALEYLVDGVLGLGIGPDPIQFVGVLTNPTRAYLVATTAAFPADVAETAGVPALAGRAWYVQPEVATAILVAWLVLPVCYGCYRFERADL